ncbi:MAG: alanine/glycine:cation symporter family protein [Actinomycetaceae bacterium]|nr:alanine/glycine:cation symporter family protein [Actinomycetaceae bacterium]
MTAFADLVSSIEGFISTKILVYVLVGLGLVFTVATRGVQFRRFGTAVSLMLKSRKGSGEALSSFQAFTVGLASRVGTGNIAGVALALVVGGPGALFWMWVVALLGMATSFMESTLAQLFKVPWGDRIYRGGPAYYIERGLGSRTWGVVFAALLVFSYGLFFPMVQSNTIAIQFGSAMHLSPWATAAILVLISVPIILKGLRMVARVTEVVVPFMAIVYLAIAVFIIILNISALPGVLSEIFRGAFGLDPALAGTAGGVFATFLNGSKRGLFSNEAGQGSMPNGAATAEVAHPVQQGLIQALGTFVDTILVCSATGFMILLAGPSVYRPGREYSDSLLAQDALTHHLDFGTGWTVGFMTLVVFLFAYSSTLGYSVFAEVNIDYLGWGKKGVTGLHILMIVATGLGAIVKLELAWNLADLALALMTIVNMIAVALLLPYGVACLRDYDRQRKAGVENPVFVAAEAGLPRDILDCVWTSQQAERSRELASEAADE